MSQPKSSPQQVTKLRHCRSGKRRYSTLKEAQEGAAALAHRRARQGNVVVTWLRAYGCTCGGFHFGSSRNINWSLVK